jgi:hypothetical protein
MEPSSVSFYKVRDWVSKKHLNPRKLSAIPNEGVIQLLSTKDRFRAADKRLLLKNPIAFRLIDLTSIDDMDRNSWCYLSMNETILPFLEQNLDKVNWSALSGNVAAIHLLERHLDLIDWSALSSNVNAIHLLEQHPDKIDWFKLSRNPKAIHLLTKNIDRIHWPSLSSNINAIDLLAKNLGKVDWSALSTNFGAVPLLAQHIDKIDWLRLCTNRNPKAICLLEQYWDTHGYKYPKIWTWIADNPAAIDFIKKHLDKVGTTDNKVDWYHLSANEAAMDILPHYRSEISWYMLSQNPGIFTYDYKEIEKYCLMFKEELMERVFHPKNYDKFAAWGFEEFT